MANQAITQVGYGLTQALQNQAPIPIPAKRAPTENDTGYNIGQIWINTSANTAYVLTSVVANVANWLSI
jgi:hypothetical protein